jgi:hypothetical protein
MLSDGMYVRFKDAPHTRMGTLSGMRDKNGRRQFLFHHDQRFRDTIPDSYVFEDEVEECQPPTGAQVHAINALLKGS